jgi:hypothetical protein
MSLNDLLSAKQASIAQRWLDKTIQTYPPDTASFFKRERDEFANPVGAALRTGTRKLVSDLLEGAGPDALWSHLDPMLRVRSVQDLSASQAVSFIFLLKDAAREELADALQAPTLCSAYLRFEARIDALALLAFDVYTRCREQVHEIRVKDVTRRVSGLMRQLGVGMDELTQGPDVPVSDLRRAEPQGNGKS